MLTANIGILGHLGLTSGSGRQIDSILALLNFNQQRLQGWRSKPFFTAQASEGKSRAEVAGLVQQMSTAKAGILGLMREDGQLPIVVLNGSSAGGLKPMA